MGILLCLVVLISGCCASTSSGNPTIAPSTNNYYSSTPVPTSAPVATAIPSISLSGSGSQATDKFHLERGLAIVSATYNGDGNFIGTLMDSYGHTAGIPINGLNAYAGSQAVEITNSGDYVLNIETDSITSHPWTITITQPRGEQGASVPQSYSGKGDSVVGPIKLNSGLATFKTTSSADGAGNFIVTLYDNNGGMAGIPANAIGANSGSQAISIYSNGAYYLNVIYDGSWTVQVSE